jgi:hypothetical protein
VQPEQSLQFAESKNRYSDWRSSRRARSCRSTPPDPDGKKESKKWHAILKDEDDGGCWFVG